MIINGINRVLTGNTEGFYYATEKMLANNLLIEESNRDGETEIDIDTWVTLYHYNDNDAMLFTLAIEKSIPSLVVLSMVKEVINLLETNSFDEFLEIMRELSVSYMSDSMQTVNKGNVKELVLIHFEDYKELI